MPRTDERHLHAHGEHRGGNEERQHRGEAERLAPEEAVVGQRPGRQRRHQRGKRRHRKRYAHALRQHVRQFLRRREYFGQSALGKRLRQQVGPGPRTGERPGHHHAQRQKHACQVQGHERACPPVPPHPPPRAARRVFVRRFRAARRRRRRAHVCSRASGCPFARWVLLPVAHLLFPRAHFIIFSRRSTAKYASAAKLHTSTMMPLMAMARHRLAMSGSWNSM